MTTIETRIDENLAKLEAQLERWSSKLEDAVGRARVTGQEVKADAKTQLDELKARLGAARAKLDEAKAAGADKWATLERGLERTWKELEGTVSKLLH